MVSVGLQIFCWIALAVTAFGSSAIFGLGRSYHADSGGSALFAAMAAPVLIAVLLVLVHRVRKGPLTHFIAIVDGALGLLLAGFGLYMAVSGASDFVFYIWPLLLGVGLVFLAFESKQGRAE